MHVETLKTFCDVVETGSLSRAARANRVTQSAVSQQLRALERRYGLTLIERAPRIGARATPAGKLLHDEVKPLLERLAAVEQRLRDKPGVVSGTVRVATVYSVGLHTLPPVLKTFLSARREVNLRVEYRRTDQVYDACLSGEVDLGIVALPSRRPRLEIVPLADEEMVVTLPPEHPLAKRHEVRASSLRALPFIAFDRDIPTRKLIDRYLRRHGVTVAHVMELDNIETIKRSVEAGLGVSILPLASLSNEIRAHSLVARSLAGRPLRRGVGVLRPKRRELSEAARAFLATVEAELGAG